MSVEDQTGGADRRTLNRESSAEIFSVMSTLPEDQRTVLALRYYEELSLDEIVEVTGWRLGTVKSRIFRGLRNSKKRLEEPTHLRLVGEPSKPGKEGVG